MYKCRDGAESWNTRQLRKLPGRPVHYHAYDTGLAGSDWLAYQEISLKVGAEVMLIDNHTHPMLSNGSRGKVKAFRTTQLDGVFPILVPIVTFTIQEKLCDIVVRPVLWTVKEEGLVVSRRTQIPLIPAWALTMHKCIGMNLERIAVHVTKHDQHGLFYTALTRVKKLGDIYHRPYHQVRNPIAS